MQIKLQRRRNPSALSGIETCSEPPAVNQALDFVFAFLKSASWKINVTAMKHVQSVCGWTASIETSPDTAMTFSRNVACI